MNVVCLFVYVNTNYLLRTKKVIYCCTSIKVSIVERVKQLQFFESDKIYSKCFMCFFSVREVSGTILECP